MRVSCSRVLLGGGEYHGWDSNPTLPANDYEARLLHTKPSHHKGGTCHLAQMHDVEQTPNEFHVI